MLKPPVVTEQIHVERVNYRASLDEMQIFSLGGEDYFGIDDAVSTWKSTAARARTSSRSASCTSRSERRRGDPNADVFATIETTRGFLSNGIRLADSDLWW